MIFTAAGLVNEGAIESAVRKVEKEFSPDVVRINHSFGEDVVEAPAVFFVSWCATRPRPSLASRNWRSASLSLS